MAATTQTNRKKLLLPTTLAKAGWAIVEAREDVEGVPYQTAAPKAELREKLEDVAGVALSVTPFSDPDSTPGRASKSWPASASAMTRSTCRR